MTENRKHEFLSTSPFIPHGGKNLRKSNLPDKCDPDAEWQPYNHHKLGSGMKFVEFLNEKKNISAFLICF